MKNKKLFAILTLVCFMFTLMPVAAFADNGTYYYAELKGNTAVAQNGSLTVTVDTDDASADFYGFAYLDGAYSKEFGLTQLTNPTTVTTGGVTTYTFTVAVPQTAPAGEYAYYVVDGNTDSDNVFNHPTMMNKEKAAKMLADTTLVAMIKNSFTVTAQASDYAVTIAPAAGHGTTVSADAGYTSVKAVVTVMNTTTNRPVANKDVEVYTDSYGLQVTKLAATTNARGQMEILITGTIPSGVSGFSVYAEYEDAVSAPYTITVNSVGVASVEVAASPAAPKNNQSTNAANSGIEFVLKDAHGVKVAPTASNHKVALISAPAGVNKEISLKLQDVANDDKEALIKAYNPNTGVYSDLTLTVNGEYTFKVSLQNGATATASVKVADYDKTVAIKFVKAPTTVAYGAQDANVYGDAIIALDAKGVSTTLYPNRAMQLPVGLSLSVNGKAVQNFDANGLDVFNDDKYIDSTITVIAVYKDGTKTFTATNEMTVVDLAATVKYVAPTAEVGKNATLYADIVDATGAVTEIANVNAIDVIVLEKPENAVVSAVATQTLVDGQVEVAFLASAAGEYKVQTIVKTSTNKYISGIETITVGGTQGQFKDVVVMSIGAANIVVNSDVKAIAAAPMIQDGRTFVPFRALAEAFGAEVEWVEATQSVVAELNGVKVVMNIGEKAYTVDGKVLNADVAPFINGASTMVPVRFVAEAFGINVTPIAAADGSVADVLFAK